MEETGNGSKCEDNVDIASPVHGKSGDDCADLNGNKYGDDYSECAGIVCNADVTRGGDNNEVSRCSDISSCNEARMQRVSK